MSEPVPTPTPQEQEVIDLVLAWLASGSMSPPDEPWRARPLLDGWVVHPVTRRRGTGTFVVRGRTVRHVPSNRTRTEEEVYQELVAEQEG